MATELGQTDIEAGGRKLWQLFKLLSLGHGIMSTLPWNMYVWPVKRLFQQTNLEDFVRVFFGRNYRFKYENWITFALTRNQFWVNMRNICISYQTSDRNSDSDSHFKLLSKGHGINVNYMYGLLKFGLSEKHKKFEKICPMVLTN